MSVFVGIDVGGSTKGFHAVTLKDGEIADRLHSRDTAEVLAWCLAHTPAAIGIDAPCRWRSASQARTAEREMAQEKIFCFSTPSEEAAHGISFHQWMLQGAALYAQVEKHFPLFDGEVRGPMCFETFPHAVACALAGRVVSAARKRFERKVLLDRAGVATATLTSIDYVDAALCALAARQLVAGSFKAYGDKVTGFIVVPKVEAHVSPFRRRHGI